MGRLNKLTFYAALLIAAPALPDEASQCTKIEDAMRRLACYDAAHGRTSEPTAAPAAEFGMGERLRREKLDEKPDPGPESITAAIVEASKDGRGYYVLKLDNGQTWQVTEASRLVRYRPGQQVTIRRAALGSFLLRPTEGGSAMRARRVN